MQRCQQHGYLHILYGHIMRQRNEAQVSAQQIEALAVTARLVAYMHSYAQQTID